VVVAENNPKPGAEADADIEAQIDALAAEATGQAAGTGASPPATEAAADGAGAPDLVGDALAQQIQQLLDDAQAHSGQLPAPAQAAPAAATEPAKAQADAKAIEEIDNHLALEADKAIAGAFETVQEVVMGAEPKAAEPAATEPAVEAPAPAPAAAASAPVVEPPAAAEAPVPVAAAVAAPASASGGATAQDVARELDEQPVAPPAAAASAPAAAAAAPIPVPAPEPTPPAVAAKAKPARAATAAAPAPVASDPPAPAPAALGARIDRSLRQFFAVLNRPLLGLSPGLRQTLGLVALLTVFNAACLLVYAKALKGRSTPQTAASAVESHGGGPGGHAEVQDHVRP
jgi:hypothetical protein